MNDRITILKNVLAANGRELPQTEQMKAANRALSEAIAGMEAHNAELSRQIEARRLERIAAAAQPSTNA